MKTPDILQTVSSGISDIGIIFLTAESKDLMIQRLRQMGLVFNHIAYQPVHVYLRKGHPLSTLPALCRSELEPFPFISYDRSLDAGASFTSALGSWQTRVVHVSDRAAAYSIMEMANGYLIGSGFLTEEEQQRGIVTLPLADEIQWEIGWLTRAKTSESEWTRRFLLRLQEQMQSQNS